MATSNSNLHTINTATLGHKPEPIIRIQAIRKSYVMGESEVHALKGIDIGIRAGEFCSIMGPSGSGKSTLMNVIGCLDKPDGGSYWFDGQLVEQLNDHQVARVRNSAIGFIFQSFNLMPNATAIENVEMPMIYARVKRKIRRQRAASALRDVGLFDRAFHKPGQLSGGQRQRVAIARALVMQPRILLADEPTGNLDLATATEILRLMHVLHDNGNTILLVTHDPSVARHAGRIIQMSDGRIVSDRTMQGQSS